MLNKIIIILFVGLFYSCDNQKPKQEYYMNEDERIEFNKDLAAEEDLAIDLFVKRKEWKVNKTGTGMRYTVYQKGEGRKIEDQDIVHLIYEVSLLDGTICYSNKDESPQVVKVNMDHVESGLHEALSYLNIGDKAKIILPPHLAHGLIGDMDKIPPYSAVVYDVHVMY